MMRRDVECVQLLIEHGAKLDIKNHDDKTPVDMLDMEFDEIKNFLSDYCCVYTLKPENWSEKAESIRKLIEDNTQIEHGKSSFSK